MGNPVPVVTFGIPDLSYDGFYYSRYPNGFPQANGAGASATATPSLASAIAGALASAAGVARNATASTGGAMGAAAAVGAGVVATAVAALATASQADPMADWLLRSGQDPSNPQPGVVWFHDFQSDAEVDNFRWTNAIGNNPNAAGTSGPFTRRITTDGPTGACLEILRPAGDDDGSDWWRPLSPIVGSGNGRGVDDPGANGTITPQAYAPTQGGSQIQGWGSKGYYGHSSYHTGSVFDGDEYFLQMRVKMDPRRTTSGNTQIGKSLYQTLTDASLTEQEIVTYSGAFETPSDVGEPNIFRMYGGTGHGPLEDADSINRPGAQVGSDLADYGSGIYCQAAGDDGVPGGSFNTCWAYSGGWDTLLYHVSPGREGVEEFRIRVYAAHPDDSSYTKIWDEIFIQNYENGYPNGYNAIIASIYNNGNTNSEFWHRYAQFIFSHDIIPCPGAIAEHPAWIDIARANGWDVGEWCEASGDTPSHGLSATNTCFDVAPSDWATRGDQASVMSAYCGGTWASRAGAYGKFIAHGGGHGDNQGNEMYGWDAGSRFWGRLSEPYPAPASYSGNTDGTWPADGDQVNGSPAVPHTYDKIEYDPVRNSVWTTHGQVNSGSASTTPVHCEFKLSEGVWYIHATSGLSYGGASFAVYEPKRKRVLSHGDGGGSWRLNIYDIATNTHSNVDQSNSIVSQYTDTVAAYDSANDVLMILNANGAGFMYGLNCASLTSDWQAIATSGKPSTSGGGGFEYCAELGAFIFYQGASGNANVYSITKGSGSWSSATWTWTLLTGGGNTITPESNESAGIYSRFRIARHGKYVVAYCVKRTGQTGKGAMYAFLLSITAN